MSAPAATFDAAPEGVVAAFRRGRWLESLDVEAVPGAPDLRLSLVPGIVLRDDARRALPATAVPPPDERRAVVRRAVELFGVGTVEVGPLGEQPAVRFHREVAGLLGLPDVLVRRWVDLLAGDVERLLAADRGRDVGGSTLVWLPGNTFTCLVAVCEAVLDGATAVVRPSRHEPLSAARFVACLLAAGWPADRVRFCPTTPAMLRPLARLTDRQIVYGGPAVTRVLPASAAVDLRGPGRGCAVVDARATGAGEDAVVARLAELVAGQSGRFCTNVRTVLCLPGAPADLGERLAETLDGVALAPVDRRWPVGWHRPAAARHLAGVVRACLRADDAVLTGREVLVDAGGHSYLAPTLVRTAAPEGHPLLGLEPPFPFAAVAAADAAALAALTGGARYVYAGPGLELQERTPTR